MAGRGQPLEVLERGVVHPVGARPGQVGGHFPVPGGEIRQLIGGEGRDGGSVERRNTKVYVWNTKPKNQEYYTDKWNEFLAS